MVDKISNIPCVILAGGKSSRMKRDKCLVDFKDNLSLVEYQYNKLSKIFSNVYISSKQNKFDFLDNDSKIIFDNEEESSPMIALESIFKVLNSTKVFIVPVDVPLIEIDTIYTLIKEAQISYADIIVPKDDDNHIHNLCGVFSNEILPTVSSLLQKDIHKIQTLIKSVKCENILFENKAQFININTPQNLEDAKKKDS